MGECMIDRNYIRFHKPQDPQIVLLMEELKKTFPLDDIGEIIQDYDSIEKLDEAFCDNVVYENQTRKRDMGYILYALLSLFYSSTDILSEIDEKKTFCAISVFALNLMPRAWQHGWLCDDLKLSIDPYLEVYSPEESQTVLHVIVFLAKADFFTEDLSEQEISDIIIYWEKMAYHREQLQKTKELVKILNKSNITWNDYLEEVRITRPSENR